MFRSSSAGPANRRPAARILTVLASLAVLAAMLGAASVAPEPAAAVTPVRAFLNGLPQKAGVGLVDPGQGLWYLRDGDGDVTVFFYGNPGDIPFMGDWDCDGDDTPGLFRQSDAFAYLRNSNTAGPGDIRFFFGDPDDIPLAGDFNGDGCDTVSIYRPSEQRFYIINELGENEGGLGAADFFFTFGNPGDKPVVGDWDGDGIDEVGLHRESTGFFYYRNTLDSGIATDQFFFGDPGDRFVAADWTADGKASPAIFRPSDASLYFRFTLTPGNADDVMPMGLGPWLPVAGDFGPLASSVTTSISGAPEDLARTVEALFLFKQAAPDLPAGLRAHIAGLGTAPTATTVSGAVGIATVKGVEVAAVTAGSDVVLAAKIGGRWQVVGAKLARFGTTSWYGGSSRLVLILGGDAEVGGDPLRSNADSVHVLGAAPGTGAGAIVGLPRDTFVNAPYGLDKIAITMRDKLNGQPFGPATTLTTMRNVTGLPIEGYMMTAFDGFSTMVDGFGGFSANLEYGNPDATPPLPPGVHVLNGSTALSSARHRVTLPSGDVDRTLNQGDLMEGALAKVKGMGMTAVPGLLDLLDGLVFTDLSAISLLTLAATAIELGPVPNVAVEGDVTTATVRGEVLFGFGLTPLNLTTFADLADGVLDSGRCTTTSNPSSNVACWQRP